MSKWYDKPTKIKEIKQNIDYIMCIDENGISNLINIKKQIVNGKELSIDDKYFTITGVIFTRDEYIKSKIKIKKLKDRHWKNGNFYDAKARINKAVCFHSREIRRQEKCFSENSINYSNFIADLSDTLKDINCNIISVSINLFEYLNKDYNHNIYNVAFDFLIERFIYNIKNNKKGIIMLESRGKGEDKVLLKHIHKVINYTGTKKINKKELNLKIIGVYFNPKWNDEYSYTYVGLEIADLFSYPIHKFIKRNYKDKAFLTIEKKIVGYPNYINKGIKVFPKTK